MTDFNTFNGMVKILKPITKRLKVIETSTPGHVIIKVPQNTLFEVKQVRDGYQYIGIHYEVVPLRFWECRFSKVQFHSKLQRSQQ